MGMLKFGQTVTRRLHVRSFSSHAAQNEARPQGKVTLTAKGYANLAVLCAPFYYWVLYRIDFAGVRTLRRAAQAEDAAERDENPCICCRKRQKYNVTHLA